MTYHLVCTKSNTKGTTSGAGTAYPSESSEFTPAFCEVHVVQSLFFCVVFFIDYYLSSLFWPLYCLSSLQITASDYPFCIFWLPLLYLLITPLVSSDYLFGIFKLFLLFLLYPTKTAIHLHNTTDSYNILCDAIVSKWLPHFSSHRTFSWQNQ